MGEREVSVNMSLLHHSVMVAQQAYVGNDPADQKRMLRRERFELTSLRLPYSSGSHLRRSKHAEERACKQYILTQRLATRPPPLL